MVLRALVLVVPRCVSIVVAMMIVSQRRPDGNTANYEQECYRNRDLTDHG